MRSLKCCWGGAPYSHFLNKIVTRCVYVCVSVSIRAASNSPQLVTLSWEARYRTIRIIHGARARGPSPPPVSFSQCSWFFGYVHAEGRPKSQAFGFQSHDQPGNSLNVERTSQAVTARFMFRCGIIPQNHRPCRSSEQWPPTHSTYNLFFISVPLHNWSAYPLVHFPTPVPSQCWFS